MLNVRMSSQSIWRMTFLLSFTATTQIDGSIMEPYGAVLEHGVNYTHTPPIPHYTSNSSFDPRGMEHVYMLTDTFLHLIQRQHVLPKGVNATSISRAVSGGPNTAIPFLETHWQELLLQHIGVLTAAVFGLILAILLPVIGFFFFCCRCCGNCGAYPETTYDKRFDSCKRIFLGLLLSIFVICVMFGSVCSFVTNYYSYKGYSQVSKKLATSLEDSSMYVDHTGASLDILLVKNFEEMEEVVNTVLNESGSIVRNKLNNITEAVSIETISSLVNKLGSVRSNLRDIASDTRELEDQVNQLKSGLTKSQETLGDALAMCEDHSACRRFTNDYKLDEDLGVSDSYIGLSFTAPNHGITNTVSAISDLLENDLVDKVEAGKTELDSMEAAITAAVREVAPDVRTQLRTMGEELREKNGEIRAILGNIAISPLLEDVPQLDTLTLDWVKYRYYTGLGMASLVLLILACFVLGLFYGFCGKRAGSLYGDDCCNKGTGANFLATGIYLVFLFGFPVLLLNVTHFLLGSTVEKAVCETLTQPEKSDIFTELDREVLTPRLKDLLGEVRSSPSGHQVLDNCHHNLTLYMVLGLESEYGLTKLKEWRDRYDLRFFLAALNVNYSLNDVTLLTPETRIDLEELARSPISQLDFTQLLGLDDERVTKVDLDRMVRKLRSLKDQLARQGGMRQLANRLENEVRAAEIMSRVGETLKLTVRRLKTRINTLQEAIKVGENSLPAALTTLLAQTSRAEVTLRESGSAVVSDLSSQLVRDTEALVDKYVDRLEKGIMEEVGTCSPLSTSYNATVVAVCSEVVLPFNAFWASIGWCYLLYLPCILLSVSVIKLYRKTESYPGPHEMAEVQPLDGRDKDKVRRRAHRRTQSSCRLPEVTHSRALPALPPDEDANAPPRYSSNPSIAIPEYERPPPYYFPNRGK